MNDMCLVKIPRFADQTTVAMAGIYKGMCTKKIACRVLLESGYMQVAILKQYNELFMNKSLSHRAREQGLYD